MQEIVKILSYLWPIAAFVAGFLFQKYWEKFPMYLYRRGFVSRANAILKSRVAQTEDFKDLADLHKRIREYCETKIDFYLLDEAGKQICTLIVGIALVREEPNTGSTSVPVTSAGDGALHWGLRIENVPVSEKEFWETASGLLTILGDWRISRYNIDLGTSINIISFWGRKEKVPEPSQIVQLDLAGCT